MTIRRNASCIAAIGFQILRRILGKLGDPAAYPRPAGHRGETGRVSNFVTDSPASVNRVMGDIFPISFPRFFFNKKWDKGE